eukprot:7448815-Alexandrium_andersonii.AAC.1
MSGVRGPWPRRRHGAQAPQLVGSAAALVDASPAGQGRLSAAHAHVAVGSEGGHSAGWRGGCQRSHGGACGRMHQLREGTGTEPEGSELSYRPRGHGEGRGGAARAAHAADGSVWDQPRGPEGTGRGHGALQGVRCRVERLARVHLWNADAGHGWARWSGPDGHRPGLPTGSGWGGPAARGGGPAAATGRGVLPLGPRAAVPVGAQRGRRRHWGQGRTEP